MSRTVAALFVERCGAYYGLGDVVPWDNALDARRYPGPYSVVAHPPCERWGRYATMGGRKVGDDNGCFRSALLSVYSYGGVLEHPKDSLAWAAFHLRRPTHLGWTRCQDYDVCEVWQGNYGHLAPKPTWLLLSGWGDNPLPDLSWGKPLNCSRRVENLSHRQRSSTPEQFRDVLLYLARGCGVDAKSPYGLGGVFSSEPEQH